MLEVINKHKEIISILNTEIDDLKVLLVGLTPRDTECCDTMKEECLLDTVKINTNGIDYALAQIRAIKEIIKGGK